MGERFVMVCMFVKTIFPLSNSSKIIGIIGIKNQPITCEENYEASASSTKQIKRKTSTHMKREV